MFELGCDFLCAAALPSTVVESFQKYPSSDTEAFETLKYCALKCPAYHILGFSLVDDEHWPGWQPC